MSYMFFPAWGWSVFKHINGQTIILYLVIMNILAIILYGLDKKAAASGVWRISEWNLFWVAILGGGLGGWLAMHLFRHKTQKLKFVLGLPVIILLQLMAVYYFLLKPL